LCSLWFVEVRLLAIGSHWGPSITLIWGWRDGGEIGWALDTAAPILAVFAVAHDDLTALDDDILDAPSQALQQPQASSV